MELMADSAQRACVYLDGASENMWLCVWAFPSLLHVLCFTPGFCASCVFVDEPVSRGWADWQRDWAIILSKREKLIIWLHGLGVTSGPSTTHWSTESRALGRSMCVCVCLRSCAHLHFLWMCVCEGFSTKQRKPVWVVWGDALWTRCWVICCTSSSVMITATRWYFNNTYFFRDTF